MQNKRRDSWFLKYTNYTVLRTPAFYRSQLPINSMHLPLLLSAQWSWSQRSRREQLGVERSTDNSALLHTNLSLPPHLALGGLWERAAPSREPSIKIKTEKKKGWLNIHIFNKSISHLRTSTATVRVRGVDFGSFTLAFVLCLLDAWMLCRASSMPLDRL